MPLLSTLGSASLGAFRASGTQLGKGHWITLLSKVPVSNKPVFYDIDLDSTKEMAYVVGQLGTSPSKMFIAGLNTSSGSLVIQKQFTLNPPPTGVVNSVSGTTITVDQNKDIVVSGSYTYEAGGNSASHIIKLDSNLDILFQRRYGNIITSIVDTSRTVVAGDHFVNPNTGTIFVSVGQSSNGGTNTSASIILYGNNGAQFTSYQISSTDPGNESGAGVCLDRSDENKMIFTFQAQSNNNVIATRVYTHVTQVGISTRLFNWSRRYTLTGHNLYPYATQTDLNGNVYVLGNGRPDGVVSSYYIFLVKHSPAGILRWQRMIESFSGDLYATNIDVDDSGNVYIVGTETRTSARIKAYIAKYDTNGVFLWHRFFYLEQNNQNNHLRSIKVDNLGSIYVCGYNQANNVGIIAKLPDGGGKTGTFSVGHLTVTYTDADPSCSNTNTSFTITNISTNTIGNTLLGSAASNLVIQTSDVSSSIKII